MLLYVFAAPEFLKNNILMVAYWYPTHPKYMATSILYTGIQSSTQKQIFRMVCDRKKR